MLPKGNMTSKCENGDRRWGTRVDSTFSEPRES